MIWFGWVDARWKEGKKSSWEIVLKIWVLMNCNILYENSGFIYCVGKYLMVDILEGKFLVC